MAHDPELPSFLVPSACLAWHSCAKPSVHQGQRLTALFICIRGSETSGGTYPAAKLCKAATEVGEHERLRAQLARKVAGHGRRAVLRYACLGVHVRREGRLMRQ